jgi:hypothetical protein
MLSFVWLQFGGGTQDNIATTSGMRAPVHAITMMSMSRSVGRGGRMRGPEGRGVCWLSRGQDLPGLVKVSPSRWWCYCRLKQPTHQFVRCFRRYCARLAVTHEPLGCLPPPALPCCHLRTQLAKTLPPRYGYVFGILEQLSICKYRGRPHWGKMNDR